MMPTPTSSTATSVSTEQRKLIIAVIIATLAAFVIVIAELAAGGRPDPPALRAAATLLDGPWQFHTGDDPRWADVTLDDHDWEAIDMTALPGSHDGDVGLPDYVSGWMAHGHTGYTGYAWYRRVVNVPTGHTEWDILGPTAAEDGYELYWNGKLLGGSGTLGANPRVVNTRPLRFALPADAAGTRGVIAIRAFMLSRAQPSADGGGMRSAPILAPRPVSDGLHHAHWQRTIAGYIVDAIEPLAMFLVIGLVLWCWPRSTYKAFLIVLSIALVLTAVRRLNNATVSWTDLMDLRTYSWMAKYASAPTIAAWIFAWNRWCVRPWRTIDVSALVLALAGIVGTVIHSPTLTSGCRIGSLALFAVVGARIVRSGPMRILSTLTFVTMMLAFFGSELLDPIRVPGIWFPFGIGVSRTQYLYAIAFPLLAILIIRTLREKEPDGRSRSESPPS
jgi:hypothetical protein